MTPSLTALNAELPPPPPTPWWIRHSDLLACIACGCIWGFTFYAIGALK